MKNRLFLVCPASQAEQFIRKKNRGNSFFLKALGSIFTLQEEKYVAELTHFIEAEAIEEVIVVQDISCCFIQSILSRQKGFETHAEQVLLDLLLDHYSYVMEGQPAEQKKRLAQLNVEHQIQELLALDFFWQQVVLQRLKVTGLLTSTAEGNMWPVCVTPRVSYV